MRLGLCLLVAKKGIWRPNETQHKNKNRNSEKGRRERKEISFLIPSSLFLFFFFLSLLIPFVTIFRDFRSLNEVVHQREVQP